MTPERDEYNEEIRRRHERRQRQQQTQKKQQRQAILRLVMVILALVLAAVLIFWAVKKAPDGTSVQQPTETVDTTPVPSTETISVPTEETDATEQAQSSRPDTVIHIAAAGDLNVTDEILSDAMTQSGYDFSRTFLEAAPVLAAADLAVLNFEGTMAGAPYGTQTGSAPPELVQAVANMGVDLVQTANSASVRAGVLGLRSTISGLENAGLTPVGTFADSAAFRSSGGYTLVEVDGIRIAFVAFTKGMDNLGLPEGSEDCVNLLYEDYTTDYKKINTEGIQDVLRNAASREPDITIALLHWGSEYNENISDSQEEIRDLMMAEGVDVILGTHSHLLQAIEFDETAGTLVAWSLGDFFGNATEAGSNYSVILDLEITLDGDTGLTSVTGYSTTPIYTLKPAQNAAQDRRVVQIEKAIARYESKYIDRVTEDAYSSLQYALTRIPQRIAGD